MSDRDLEHLHPELREKAKLWLLECAKQAAVGDKYIIVCTYRSNEDQAAAYAVGRTGPRKNEPIITKAKPGQSKHNKVNKLSNPASEAFDFGVIRYGKYISDGEDIAYKLGGAIAESLGLEWAGGWAGEFKESAHIQMKS